MSFPGSSNSTRILFGLFALCAIVVFILIIIVAMNNSNTQQTQKQQQGDFSSFSESVKSQFNNLSREGEMGKERMQEVDAALEKIRTDRSKDESQMKMQLQELKDTIKDLNCQLQILKSNGSQMACCPPKWLTFSGSCYYFSTQRKSWEESKRYCLDEKAHLVVINTQTEQSFVEKQSMPDYHWIGLTDVDGQWKWVDGTSYDSAVKNWIQGQPDEYFGHGLGGGEDCAHLHANGQWNDDHCSRLYKWICEKEMN
ncbi:asialoglycoprotein receptor 1-like isoform X2 [Rhinatrema bivittatum]|nr:asialoglycoprotein receptor 1-like isoform X2 [Rhinatrema bivittatum]XP_029436898.1 asialoglycoprotein receptor 1-like isoform X2 [Rhinatrema bivittatum]